MRYFRRNPPSLFRVFKNPAIFWAAACKSSIGMTNQYRRGGPESGARTVQSCSRTSKPISSQARETHPVLTPSEKESVSLKTRPTISLPFQEIATLRMRSFSILMFGVALTCGAGFAHAQGGPPFITDDPAPPGNHHWEINFGWIADHNPGNAYYQTPDVD